MHHGTDVGCLAVVSSLCHLCVSASNEQQVYVLLSSPLTAVSMHSLDDVIQHGKTIFLLFFSFYFSTLNHIKHLASHLNTSLQLTALYTVRCLGLYVTDGELCFLWSDLHMGFL